MSVTCAFAVENSPRRIPKWGTHYSVGRVNVGTMRSILEKNKYATKFTTRRHRAPHYYYHRGCRRHDVISLMITMLYRVVAIAFGGCGRPKFIVTSAAATTTTYYKRSGRKPIRLHCPARRRNDNILLYIAILLLYAFLRRRRRRRRRRYVCCGVYNII